MSAGVGEEIEDHKAGFAAVEDQILGAVLFFEGKAESATLVVFVPPYVFRPPGGVDVLHGDNFSRYWGGEDSPSDMAKLLNFLPSHMPTDSSTV